MFLEKERIIARFKDYSKELEKILTDKPFSKTVKNLLLSLFYKISNSYDDYKKTKVEVPLKNDFLQELLDIIYRDCKGIEIIEPTINNNIIENNECKVVDNRIITYQNELSLLEQIYKINSNKFKIEAKNKIIENALSNILNKGEEINKSEVIRDFDGWSWNTIENHINFEISSLVYIGMTYFLGYETLNKSKTVSIAEIENMLRNKFEQSFAEKIIKSICQIAIMEYIKNNPEEKEKVLEIRDDFKKEIELICNKKEYIEKASNEKKNCIIECEKIDKYLNDDLLLKKEYIRQNEKLPQEERVFSLSDFSEKVLKQKEDLEKKIIELTEKLKPRNYIKLRNSLEKEYSFYSDLDFENNNVDVFIRNFINLLLKALIIETSQITMKKDVIEKIYIIRYLNVLRIKNSTLGVKYKKIFNEAQKALITVGCNLKVLMIFSKDVEQNYLIYKNIFQTRIIDLDNLYIEITKNNDLKIYDEESIERKINDNYFNELNIKYNKRYKIFL